MKHIFGKYYSRNIDKDVGVMDWDFKMGFPPLWSLVGALAGACGSVASSWLSPRFILFWSFGHCVMWVWVHWSSSSRSWELSWSWGSSWWWSWGSSWWSPRGQPWSGWTCPGVFWRGDCACPPQLPSQACHGRLQCLHSRVSFFLSFLLVCLFVCLFFLVFVHHHHNLLSRLCHHNSGFNPTNHFLVVLNYLSITSWLF